MPFQFIGDSTNAIYSHLIRFAWIRGYSCSFKLANSALVQYSSGNVIPGTVCGDPTQRKSTSTTKTRGTTPLVVETNASVREGVREEYCYMGSSGANGVGLFQIFNLLKTLKYH